MRKNLLSERFEKKIRTLRAFKQAAVLTVLLIGSSNNIFGQLLIDINRDEELHRNEYSELTAGDGLLFFISNRTELWRSTGSPGGTAKLKMFKSVRDITMVGTTAFFVADDGTGSELWKSNGTIASTVVVKKIVAGDGGSMPQLLTPVGNLLFFSASGNGTGRELWKSDGTEAGTMLVKDILRVKGSSNPTGLTNLNGILFFSANDGTNGYELWKSDGTSEGTVVVKDIKAGNGSGAPQKLVTSGNNVFFTAIDETGRELWKTDGTSEGTVRVKDILKGAGSSGIDNLTDVNGRIFFSASDAIAGHELWMSDGSEAGTLMVKDLTPGKAGSHGEQPFMERIANFTNIKGLLYFTAYRNNDYFIWRSDGTEPGTVAVQPCLSVGINNSIPLFTLLGNNVFYFNAEPGDYNSLLYLWRMDIRGTSPTRVKEFYTPEDYYEEYYQEMVMMNNTLFTMGRINDGGYELIRSNGTAATTTTLKDTYQPTLGSNVLDMTTVNALVYFSAQPDWNTRSIYRTDGTPSGTFELQPMHDVYDVEASKDKLYFTGYHGSVGWQLWSSSGTPGSTRLVKQQSGPFEATPLHLTYAGGLMFYYTAKGELFKIDDASNTAVLVRDISSGSASTAEIVSIHETAGRLFMIVKNNDESLELWKSDGTYAGTTRVRVIRNTGGAPSDHYPTATVGNVFYFVADDGIHGNEVWRSDGTGAGTYMLIDLKPDNYDHFGFENDILSLGVWNNKLFISAQDFNNEWSLFTSDGTEGGTYLLGHINKIPYMVTGAHRLFLFVANSTYSPEWTDLWVTDGTAGGTYKIHDIEADGEPSYTFVDDIMYFNTSGFSIIRSDGTDCGTFEVEVGAQYPYPIASIGTQLVFGAYDDYADREPHTYNISAYQDDGCEDLMTTASHGAVTKVSGEGLIAQYYPNPFRDDFSLQVEGTKEGIAHVSVFTTAGIPVESFDNLEFNRSYRMGAGWPDGMYILRITTPQKVITQKVIKKN